MYFASNSRYSRSPRLGIIAISAPRVGISPVRSSGTTFPEPPPTTVLLNPCQPSDASILAQVFSGYPSAAAAQRVQKTAQQAMDQGALWTTENCAGIVGPSTAQLVTKGAGLATSAAGSIGTSLAIAGIATGPLMPIVALAGGIISVFSSIFGAHAAKVKQEQQIICAVVQSVNDSLTVLDQAVQQGQLTVQQASGSLDQLYTELQQNVQPILKQDGGNCNAACYILAEARAVIAKRKANYPCMAPPPPPPPPPPPAPAPVATTTPGTAANSSSSPAPVLNPQSIGDYVTNLSASLGLPSWAIWAAGALLLVKVIE